MENKNKIWVYLLISLGLFFLLQINCKKDDENYTEKTNEIIFNSDLTYGTVTDIDGNDYKTISIGSQTWMAENLRTSTYKDGDPIANITDNTEWDNLNTGAFCWYNNDSATHGNIYGKLYNWFTIERGTLCPTGWHVPTDAEWTTLTDYLGGESVAGGKLKETGTLHWAAPNAGATNETGFSALPSGFRLTPSSGEYYAGSKGSYWWSSSEISSTNAWSCGLSSNNGVVNYYQYFKSDGYSVRCVRD